MVHYFYRTVRLVLPIKPEPPVYMSVAQNLVRAVPTSLAFL